MAYDREEIYNKCIELIPKEKIVFFDDLIAYLPCSVSTFYEWFPNKSEQSETLKDLINDNKVKTKAKLRKNWEDSENATLQMGLYKLLGSEEERERLNTSYNKSDHTTNGKEIGQPLISFITTEDSED